MKAEFGFCSVCEKEIATPCSLCGTKKPGNDYTEVKVTWTNGAGMNIAVCLECATSHAWMTPEAKKGITQAHWDAWDKQGLKYDKEVVLV